MISVIIPVYNAEAYLTTCLDSILRQSYTDFEILIIDDGSSDSSLDICRVYQKRYSNIRLISQKNKGVSSARNVGLINAVGEYVCFVDADDKLSENSLEARISVDADLVVGSFEYTNEKYCSNNRILNESSMSSSLFLNYLFDDTRFGYQGYLWNKLFKLDIIRQYNIKFNENIAYNEDRLFVVTYLLYSCSVRTIPDNVYLYRINENSAMAQIENFSSLKLPKMLSELTAFELCAQILLSNKKIDAYSLCLYKYNLASMQWLIRLFNQKHQIKNNFNILKNLIISEFKLLIFCGVIRFCKSFISLVIVCGKSFCKSLLHSWKY